MNAQAKQVTVIGAGMVGICCALSLAEAGCRVSVLDRAEPGQQTSYGNAGVISPFSYVPITTPGLWKQVPAMLLDPKSYLRVPFSYLPRFAGWGLRFLANGSEAKARATSHAMERLTAPCIDLFRHHLHGTGHEGLIRDAMYIHAFRDEAKVGWEGFGYALRREKGVELELIDGEELRRLEPALSHDFRKAVLIKGQARTLSPGRLGQVLTEKAKRLGVTFEQVEVKQLRKRDRGWQIMTAAGERDVENILVAAGPWSAQLLKPLGISVPLEAERGYHVEFPDPGLELSNSVMDADMGSVASTMEGGLRFAGTAEFMGLDKKPTQQRIQMMAAQVKLLVPNIRTQGMKSWMGQRPSLPDNLPAIGEIEGCAGLFTAFGHSHWGLMMAPATGRLVAQQIMGQPPNHNVQAYAPDRFG